MSWYRTGTASISTGATAVTGTLTTWAAQAKAEDAISFDGGDTWYEIAAVNSNTSITLATAFAEASVSGGSYAIDRRGRRWSLTSELNASLAALLASVTHILAGSGAPSDELGANGDVYFDTVGLDFYGPKAGGQWPAAVSLNGSDGANGNTILSGSGAPSNGSGANGDYYINVANNTIYGPKASGVWPSGVALKGTNGTNGAPVVWEGAWLTVTAYQVLDAVSNGGRSYICTSGHTSGASTEPGVGASWATVWDLMADRGADGLGTGDVIAAATIADNRLVRGDGGAKGVQQSGVTVDDSNNISGVTSLALASDPVSALHAATKQYVDNVAAGFDIKPSVRAATTANITLSGAQTIDGIALVAGDLCLVKDQSSAAQNGIYTVASGAWTRHERMNVWDAVPGALVIVETGTTNADSGWIATADLGGTLGSTSITWARFFGTGLFQASNSLLTAIAALSMVADKIIYGTGSGTVGLADLTAAGRALLDDANASAQLTTLGVGTGNSPQFAGVNVGHASDTQVTRAEAGVIAVAGVPHHPGMPQNSQSASYTLVLADAQKHIYHPASDNTPRTFTIPANAAVAFPIGTCLTFVNSINTVTIAINSDTMTLAGSGSTGSRTLAANGIATAIKIASTSWIISGVGLT